MDGQGGVYRGVIVSSLNWLVDCPDSPILVELPECPEWGQLPQSRVARYYALDLVGVPHYHASEITTLRSL